MKKPKRWPRRNPLCNKPGCTLDPRSTYASALKGRHTHSNGMVFFEWQGMESNWPKAGAE